MAADSFLHDLRIAFRQIRRSPGFALVVILTLALGIGANTAMFTVVNAVILRPLGYPEPNELMYLTSRFPNMGFEEFWVSPPEFFEFRELNQSFAAVGAFTTGEVNLTAGDRPSRVRSASVSDDLLRALGVRPHEGRLFAAGETDVVGPPPAPGQPAPLPARVAIFSYELWRSAYGGRSMLGATIEVNGIQREVIGVLAPGADVMDNRTEIWLPLGLNPSNRQNRGSHFLYLIGRLKDGVTPAAAQTELDALVRNWGERVGVKQHVYTPDGHRMQMEPLQEQIVGGARRSIWVLQAAVGLVLLIACANLANLLVARAETRRRELAVRSALGAGRGRLLRQFMTEGLLLSVAGGALGLVLARGGVQMLVQLYPASLPRTSELSIDPMVLLFTVAMSVGTGVVFGLTPLMHTRFTGLVTALKEGGAKATAGATRYRVRRGLVVAEIGLAVMLVTGAGLLLRTVYNLMNVDAGFDRSRLVTFQIALPVARYPTALGRAQLFDRLLDRLRAVPGVQTATAMSGLPPNRQVNANDTEIDNYTAPPEGPFENVDYYQSVLSDYFDTMGIPIVEGRAFTRADGASAAGLAVVNEALVRTFWKDLNPIGQRLRPCCGDQVPWLTVVGVAKDVKQGGLDQKTGTELYLLVDQTSKAAPAIASAPATMNVVLRTTLPPAALASTVEAAMRESDASVPVVRLRGMTDVFAESIRRPRLLAQLLAMFAVLALVLAAIGTYGVLSYMVAERRREIGVRIALGANQQRVLGEVMRQGLGLTAVGLAAGLAGALAITRLLTALLFGVAPSDPATLAGVLTTIAGVAAAACLVPAWRASRVDPIVVLREE
jgi:putative ABC transport system permease protein